MTTVRRAPVRMAALASTYSIPSCVSAQAGTLAYRARLVRVNCIIMYVTNDSEHAVQWHAISKKT